MSYRHRGGPEDGVVADEIADGYSPVAMSRGRTGGLPGITQDAVWDQAEISSADFAFDRKTFRAATGQAIRTLTDEKGRTVFQYGRQRVVSISSTGLIGFDKPGDWDQIAQIPGFLSIEVSNAASKAPEPGTT